MATELSTLRMLSRCGVSGSLGGLAARAPPPPPPPPAWPLALGAGRHGERGGGVPALRSVSLGSEAGLLRFASVGSEHWAAAPSLGPVDGAPAGDVAACDFAALFEPKREASGARDVAPTLAAIAQQRAGSAVVAMEGA